MEFKIRPTHYILFRSETSPSKDTMQHLYLGHNQTMGHALPMPYPPPIAMEETQDRRLSVSGKKKCSNCNKELGMLVVHHVTSVFDVFFCQDEVQLWLLKVCVFFTIWNASFVAFAICSWVMEEWGLMYGSGTKSYTAIIVTPVMMASSSVAYNVNKNLFKIVYIIVRIMLCIYTSCTICWHCNIIFLGKKYTNVFDISCYKIGAKFFHCTIFFNKRTFICMFIRKRVKKFSNIVRNLFY